MSQSAGQAPPPPHADPQAQAWQAVLDAARLAEPLAAAAAPGAFALGPQGTLDAVPAQHPDVALLWIPERGWALRLGDGDPRRPLIELYLPICSATRAHRVTVGHLGQSLDGFIATHTGDSQFVTGHENILHLHRMRALSDAVIVGAGTVAADDPRLTTRHVPGPNPLRVVLDPGRRLTDTYGLFRDTSARTLYLCAKHLAGHDERIGTALVEGVEGDESGLDVARVLDLLWDRGCTRIFVEGGGVTVSAFLEADLLDRLQVAIASLIIGSGRPAIRLPAQPVLGDCRRPRYRVFRMGGDVLFDCELRASAEAPLAGAPVARII
ncbi:MAG: RibD family protein [Acidobacteria bacterium]|nr:RibD family protein [Acidobacteriota bacterium]